jgi:hypothetical protein
VSESQPSASQPSAPAVRGPRLRIGAIIAVVIAVGFIAWAVIGGRSGGNNSPVTSSPPAAAVGRGPVELSYSGLRTLAGVLAEPIYWVGKKKGILYELRQTTDGKVYVRYVPPTVKAGDKRAFLTVATYPMKKAYSVTKAAAGGDGSTALNVGKDAVAFVGKGSTTNAYVAFPGADYQIEVYSPTPGEAQGLVEQHAVARVP